MLNIKLVYYPYSFLYIYIKSPVVREFWGIFNHVTRLKKRALLL